MKKRKKRKLDLDLGACLVIAMYVCFVGGAFLLIGSLCYNGVVLDQQPDYSLSLWYPYSSATPYQVTGMIGIFIAICLFFITAVMGWSNDRQRRQRIADIWKLKMEPPTIRDFGKFLSS